MVVKLLSVAAAPAPARTDLKRASAPRKSVSALSSEAWLTNFCANSWRVRSRFCLALSMAASASRACASAATTTWVAARSSILAMTAPFSTRSPTSKRRSTTRPVTCAETVDWRTASTTASAEVVRSTSRSATGAEASSGAALAAGGASLPPQAASASAVPSKAKRAAKARRRAWTGGGVRTVRPFRQRCRCRSA